MNFHRAVSELERIVCVLAVKLPSDGELKGIRANMYRKKQNGFGTLTLHHKVCPLNPAPQLLNPGARWLLTRSSG